MLGFCPEHSTLQNLNYGKKLLSVCNHGSVWQMHKWWQDPNMYYAFESKKGANWVAQHGGPKNFMKMVAAAATEKATPTLPSPFKVEPMCHSCMKTLGSFTKSTPLQVYRCMCGTKITHPKCFMPTVCPICRVTASVFSRNQSLLACV